MLKKNVMTEQDILVARRLKAIWDDKKSALGLSQEKAAGKMGFSTQAAISQFLNGKIPLNKENVLKFSEILEVAPEEIDPSIATLLRPIRLAERDRNNSKFNNIFNYPLYSDDQVLRLHSDTVIGDPEAVIPSVKKAGDKGFWLTVLGHSMTAPQGAKPSFPEGMLILINPDMNPNQGDYCVAAVKDYKSLTFKRFDSDAGNDYLTPLNSAYLTIPCDKHTIIIGRVVHAQWPDNLF